MQLVPYPELIMRVKLRLNLPQLTESLVQFPGREQ